MGPGSVLLGSDSIPLHPDSILVVLAPFSWVKAWAAQLQGRISTNCAFSPAAVPVLPLSPVSLPPQNPPNFLRASALSEHISPVVVIPAEASSPDSEPITDLVEMDAASQVRMVGALWLWAQGCLSKSMLQ